MNDAFPESLYVVGPLIGEPSRLRMLWALLDGRSYTAGELAAVAGISPAAASMHLAKLSDADLLSMVSQGRNRYYHFSNEAIAHAVEALGAIQYKSRSTMAHGVQRRVPKGAIKQARVCYGHLAGEMGVEMWGALRDIGWIVDCGTNYMLDESGLLALRNVGIDPVSVTESQLRVKPCMDWTERTFHLGGPLGRRLLEIWVERGCFHRTPGSRALKKAPELTAQRLLEVINSNSVGNCRRTALVRHMDHVDTGHGLK